MKKKQMSYYVTMVGLIGILLLMLCYQIRVTPNIEDTKALIVIIVSITLAIALGAYALFLYEKNKKETIKEEKLFLYVVPIFCLLFMIAMPISKGHDEIIHWIRAYDIYQGNYITAIEEDGIPKATVPSAVMEIVDLDHLKNITYDMLPRLTQKTIDSSQTRKVDIHTDSVYSPTQFIPQVTGILIGSTITNHPLLIAYLARIINMLFSITLIYYAIKIIPFGKKILLILAMIPIVIEGMATLSTDGLTISLSFFYLAYILKLAFTKDTRVGKKEIVVLAITSVILSLCKIVYLPLVGLLLLIPTEKYKNKKSQKIVLASIWGVCVLLNLGWLVIAGNTANSYNHGYSSSQIKSVLTNPITYLQKILYTVFHQTTAYMDTMFGNGLGWNEYVKLGILPVVMMILTIIAMFQKKEEKIEWSKFQKGIAMVILISIILLIFASLTINWVQGKDYIRGIQGRYYIPILPIAIFVIMSSKIKENIQITIEDKTINNIILTIGIILPMYVIPAIMLFHV